ncbi:MAG: septal ring lytic transglycosylase RlpA family protein [Hyphomonadaceae bacterium]
MAGVSKARAEISARLVTGAAILAAVFTVGAAEQSWAQTPAPIVYKSSSPAASPTVRMESRSEGTPIAVAPNARIPTIETSSIWSEAFDLHPGAVKASFGPVPRSSVSRSEAPRALVSAAPAGGIAEPYAGPPYQVAGKWYVPAYEPNYDEVGIASWYGPTFHGKDSASGEVFDQMAMTAAHPTLPIPSLVRVTNLENNKTVVVRLNDRGPFVDDRIIDLSKAAGAALDLHGKGTAKVRVQYVGPAPAAANAAPGQPVVQKLTVRAAPLAPVAARPAPVPLPAEAKGFFLQAGSFADLGNANKLRDHLRQTAAVSIKGVTLNGSEFYRVMVGPWESRAAAEAAQSRLDVSGTKTFVMAALN